MSKYGILKIIDRKKDICKLANGEYVSLNKVESCLKLIPLIENCCVVVNSLKANSICLISPNQNYMMKMLEEKNPDSFDKINQVKTDTEKSELMIKLLEENKSLCKELTTQAVNHCLEKKLAKFEIPIKYKWVPDAWLPNSGLVTDSMKIKRKSIESFYKIEIENLFSDMI